MVLHTFAAEVFVVINPVVGTAHCCGLLSHAFLDVVLLLGYVLARDAIPFSSLPFPSPILTGNDDDQ